MQRKITEPHFLFIRQPHKSISIIKPQCYYHTRVLVSMTSSVHLQASWLIFEQALDPYENPSYVTKQ